MNKILPFLMVLMPTVCLGLDDACTKPSEFTIDKRCYVTDELKKTYPYNTVVALLDQDDVVYCTGTIIKDGLRYVYTAKHCTDVNEDNLVDETITIQTQDGATYKATNIHIPSTEAAYGNYGLAEDNLYSGDWAKYTLYDKSDNLPFTTFTTRHSGILGKLEATAENTSVLEALFPTIMTYKMFFDNNYNAQVVGYGALKIMSDKEIQDFKAKYTNFLETSLDDAVRKVSEDENLSEDEMQETIDWYKTDNRRTGFVDDGDGVNTYNKIVKEFIYGALENALSWGDYKAIFKDINNLKTSFCQLNVDGHQQGCQSWGGNSGGPIFDKDGKLMGILTRANRIIGGERHAGRDYNDPSNDDVDSDGRPDRNIHFLK